MLYKVDMATFTYMYTEDVLVDGGSIIGSYQRQIRENLMSILRINSKLQEVDCFNFAVKGHFSTDWFRKSPSRGQRQLQPRTPNSPSCVTPFIKLERADGMGLHPADDQTGMCKALPADECATVAA